MLTIRINDSRLERTIAEKARQVGKSTEELVQDLLRTALPEKHEGLNYQNLNPQAFGYKIQNSIEFELPNDENISLFADVDNTAEYADRLRKRAWRK